jgi:hypothetical protein
MLDAFNEVFMYSMEVFVLSLQHSTSSMMKSKLEQQPMHQEQQSRPTEQQLYLDITMKSKLDHQSCDLHHQQPLTSHMAIEHPTMATDDLATGEQQRGLQEQKQLSQDIQQRIPREQQIYLGKNEPEDEMEITDKVVLYDNPQTAPLTALHTGNHRFQRSHNGGQQPQAPQTTPQTAPETATQNVVQKQLESEERGEIENLEITMRPECPDNNGTLNSRLKKIVPMRLPTRRVKVRLIIPIDRGKKSIYIKVRLEEWYIEGIKDTASEDKLRTILREATGKPCYLHLTRPDVPFKTNSLLRVLTSN